MKILYVADGRSPITQRWISYFIISAHEVHLASTYPCQPIKGLASLNFVPVAMSDLYGGQQVRGSFAGKLLRSLIPVGLRTRIKHTLASFSFPRAINSLEEVIRRVQPELIHAMRIPYEGMIASIAVDRINQSRSNVGRPKLLISVWGNDFTLHANSSPKLGAYTRSTLRSCDALHTDCQRDVRLALELGFSPDKPSIVLPGAGGVDMSIFHPAESHHGEIDSSDADNIRFSIINPRGFRAYVRNDTFFSAIPLVIKVNPNVKFTCTEMAGDAQAKRWIADLGISKFVDLLPFQSQQALAELFRHAQISLSITTHDGTPNTLLEAMASGCFPIAGDIESIREWITPGENGLLVDPGKPDLLANAILQALSQRELRIQARDRNIALVRARAEYRATMHAAEEFYNQLLTH